MAADSKSSAELYCNVAIVGGGASGYFTAANLKLQRGGEKATCFLFEASSKSLAKVGISGGGRCNVTHHQFDVAKLVENYPRGSRELRGPFSRFQPKDMMQWLAEKGVATHAESDGRVFPKSNNSATIINCLKQSAHQRGVKVFERHRVVEIIKDIKGEGYVLLFNNGARCRCESLVLATGGNPSGYKLAETLGHTVEKPVPSLFTFNIDDSRIDGLAGVAFQDVQLKLKIGKKEITQRGPMLITHWGLSGPVVLKLSAWAARELAEIDYQGQLRIDFDPNATLESGNAYFRELLTKNSKKKIGGFTVDCFPKRYWQQLVRLLKLEDTSASQLSKKHVACIIEEMKSAVFHFNGKSTNKDEFVTCGGVVLKEINMKSMESKLHKGLYIIGELTNVDGITGGFNFQNAFSGAFLCANSLNQEIFADY